MKFSKALLNVREEKNLISDLTCWQQNVKSHFEFLCSS